MILKNLKYLFISLLFTLVSFSCTDRDLVLEPDNESSGKFEGDVITFSMTLDHMGGSSTRASGSGHPVAQHLEYLENYVDITKIRVLFFDNEDKFLFESKSRWIKLLDPQPDHEEWSVSVPLYTYGNDKDYDWEWEKIREKLVKNDFKIAILANRPDYQYYPDLNDNVFGDYWYDNSKPDWDRKNSVVYEGTDGVVKDVFDLHHTQFDPIYWNKSNESNGGGSAYDFIMGGNFAEKQALLSATSSWVDYSEGDTKRDPYGWDYRYARMPSEEDPIPMYGIQKFRALNDWKEGTTADLNVRNENAISLLRSVVKMEIVIPTDFADDVVMFYGNWFARCEPMDVWTPTNEIWSSKHGDIQTGGDCEWYKIWRQGLIAKYEFDYNVAAEDMVPDIDAYKKKIMWQYGIWKKEKDWSFRTDASPQLDNEFNRLYGSLSNNDFPHIFNTCIQRIQRVLVKKSYNDGDGDHYIVYCGERNINDPTDLTKLSNPGSGNSPVQYWCLIKAPRHNANGTPNYRNPDNPLGNQLKDFYDGQTYSFPIVDYEHGASVYNCVREGVLGDKRSNSNTVPADGLFKPENSPRPVGTNNKNGSNGTGMGEYMKRVQGSIYDSNITDPDAVNNQVNLEKCSYRVGDNLTVYEQNDYPVPLLRNHVYKITVRDTRTRSDGSIDFNVTSEISATKDINFKK